MKLNKIFTGLIVMAFVFSSCENQDISYPDFSYQTVYFASQYPLRTIELGEDLYVDNALDNEHKCLIKATTGGVRENKKDIVVDIKVDETLCNSMWFVASGSVVSTQVVPMPTSYYTLATNQIKIAKGDLLGGVEVQLTDAFFADPLAIRNNYVIPLLINNVQGADSVLRGNPLIANPNRCVDANWITKPKDFVLYAVKFVNKWHANYLRRGVDQITNTTTNVATVAVRHTQYVEKNEVVKASTNTLNKCTLPLSIKNNQTTVNFVVLMTFAQDGTCTLSSNTANIDITGTGKFVSKGEVKSMGGIDRDALYLDYSVNFKTLNLQYATKDTMVVRDRAVIPEYFTVVKK